MNDKLYIIFLLISIINGYLPFKNGKSIQGILVGGFLIVLTLLNLHPELGIILFPVSMLLTISFSMVHIPYWAFKTYGKAKVGRVVSVFLFAGVVFILLSPWIEDWMFSKNDAKKILNQHGLSLNDDFGLIENSAGGYRDYYHIFKLRVSENDYSRLVKEIKKSSYYEGSKDWEQVYKELSSGRDTIHFENRFDYIIEIKSETPLNDGTYHFVIKISKEDEVLEYIGSNE